MIGNPSPDLQETGGEVTPSFPESHIGEISGGFLTKKPPETSLKRLRSRTRLRSGKVTSGERWP
jgi:hypothetical protein